MQRTTIIKPIKRKQREAIIKLIIDNNGLLLIFICLFLGLLIGSLNEKIGLNFSSESFLKYLSVRQNKSFLNIFLSAFTPLSGVEPCADLPCVVSVFVELS